MSTTKADKGYLYINGKKVQAEWDLKLERDYVEATVFGDPGKTPLVTLTNVTIEYDEPDIDFDAHAAREMYDDDPVALAIIDRLVEVERENVRLQSGLLDIQEEIGEMKRKIASIKEVETRNMGRKAKKRAR